MNDRLEELSESGSTDCVMFCNGEAFYNLLDENQKPDWVYLMLKIIRDALQADQTLESYKGNLKVALLQDHTTFLEEVGSKVYENMLYQGLRISYVLHSWLQSVTFFLKYESYKRI